MIIVSTQATSDWTEAQQYRFAGVDALFQTPCTALQRFHVGEAPLENVVEASMAAESFATNKYRDQSLEEIYTGPAPFGNREREISFHRRRSFATLSFEGQAVCELDLAHHHIHLLREGGFANMVNVELLTGPAMMMLMARLKTYCLHASAVSTTAGVVGFIAESGAGKSTLAWEAGGAWRQISDDILPILYEKGQSGVKASAEFPQLKLSGACAPSIELGSPKLDYLFRINPKPALKISFRRMTKAESMLQVVRHTIAARLFSKSMMERHTKFSTYVANKVPMIELSYPRDLLQLTTLREEIVSYLADINSQSY